MISFVFRFSRKGMLPVRWMAPESLADGLFTPMSDIWSYGVLLYEMITFGSFPFQGKQKNCQLNSLLIPTYANLTTEVYLLCTTNIYSQVTAAMDFLSCYSGVQLRWNAYYISTI